MRIRLLKSIQTQVKKYPVGTVIRHHYWKQLVHEGKAEIYSGKMPPKKMKTNFFKPK